MHETKIIGLLLARDERGMDALLQHYGPLMRYVIAPILPNPHDREECLSACAMRVWDKIGQFDRQRSSWSAWLTAIARNTALNRARKDARANDTEPLRPELASPEPTPEQAVLIQERREAVQRILQQLPAGERALLYRKYYYMQPTAQIASELGMTERAVEGRLYRLKKRLRKKLGVCK